MPLSGSLPPDALLVVAPYVFADRIFGDSGARRLPRTGRGAGIAKSEIWGGRRRTHFGRSATRAKRSAGSSFRRKRATTERPRAGRAPGRGGDYGGRFPDTYEADDSRGMDANFPQEVGRADWEAQIIRGRCAAGKFPPAVETHKPRRREAAGASEPIRHLSPRLPTRCVRAFRTRASDAVPPARR